MKTLHERVFRQGVGCGIATKGAAKLPSSTDMDNLCAAHTKGVHKIFQA